MRVSNQQNQLFIFFSNENKNKKVVGREMERECVFGGDADRDQNGKWFVFVLGFLAPDSHSSLFRSDFARIDEIKEIKRGGKETEIWLGTGEIN